MRTSVQQLDGWGRLGVLIHRFRFSFISVLVTAAAALGLLAPKLPGILGGDGFRTAGDYQRAQRILERDFQQSPDTLILVFQRKDGAAAEEFQQHITAVINSVDKEAYRSFYHPLQNPAMLQGDTAYAAILLKGRDAAEVKKRTLRFAREMQQTSDSVMNISPTGFTIVNEEINRRSQSDLKKAEMIGLPIAFLVLLFSFGSLSAAILPIINGALSVGAALGLLYVIGQKWELSIFVLNVAPMIGFSLSIDFALLFVNRFREELQQRTLEEAIAVTYQTAGRAVIFSGLCVFVGLSGLFFIHIDYIQSVAISGMVVVIMSMLFSLTLLPAALSLMGKRLLKGRQEQQANSFWRKFAERVMRRPVVMIAAVLLFICICLLPLRQANLQFPGIESLPETSEARLAYETYEQQFNSGLKTYADASVIVEMKGDVMQPDNLLKLEAITRQLERDTGVHAVSGLLTDLQLSGAEAAVLWESAQRELMAPAVSAYVHGNRTVLKLALAAKPKSEEAKEWVRNFKGQYAMAEVSYVLGGVTTFEQELQDEIQHHIAVSMAVILGSTFLILMIAFRSLLIPLKAILMNMLSLSATIGIVIWLFQGGHFGLEKSTVMLVLPVFIFGLVFGLSMDYEVFLISRMYELYHETRDNNYATLEGLVSTSRIITSAALIMIVVTGAFAFTDILPVQQMGLGVALAILLDATVIRLLLVPSLMKLLGDWNWWLFNGLRRRNMA